MRSKRLVQSLFQDPCGVLFGSSLVNIIQVSRCLLIYQFLAAVHPTCLDALAIPALCTCTSSILMEEDPAGLFWFHHGSTVSLQKKTGTGFSSINIISCGLPKPWNSSNIFFILIKGTLVTFILRTYVD